MVQVEIYRTSAGAVSGFQAVGHAGFAEHGRDIVCAAVSVLTQTAVLALSAHAGVSPAVTVDEDSGRLVCRLPEELNPSQNERAQIILETMATGLQAVAREYGDYVTVKEVRVP